MKTVVCFRTRHGAFAMPVESTVSVRLADGLVPLPGAHPDVAGILPGEPPLSVLTTLGPGSGQVLVVSSGAHAYGLLVEEVTGLHRLPSNEVGPAPTGQEHGWFSGTFHRGDDLVLIADPAAFLERL